MNSIALAPIERTWQWQGLAIRYQTMGQGVLPMVCIHGFGASSDHWRHNLPALSCRYRVFAIDLVGFGGSDKPAPNRPIAYTFETWSQQVIAFCQEVVGQPAVLVGNSIGCVVALQAAVDAPEWVRSVALLNCSLRLLHERRRQDIPWHQRLSTPVVQQLLGYAPVGRFFFSRIARPQVIRKLLLQAYCRSEAVTDDLVQAILAPAQTAGAADVFLAFVRYSRGPLPEDLLPQLSCPALVVWGQDDPWEPVELGRRFADYPAVKRFIELSGVGHCPQDEAPDLVNPILLDWAASYSGSSV